MMFKYVIKYWLVTVSVVAFSACSSANNKPLSADFTADSTGIQFDNIDQTGLHHLNSLPEGDSALYTLISVLQTPSEDDSVTMEKPVEGKIILTDSNIVFQPDTAFIKGHSYLVISHLNLRFSEAENIIKGDLKFRQKPYQKILIR